MTTLVIDRSTRTQSVALVEDGRIAAAAVLDGSDSRSGDWAPKTLEFAKGSKIDRIVTGTGPGSFAGIRAAIAFAQGYSIGSGCETFGIPSACAYAHEGERIAAIGDSRRGRFWLAVFDGFEMKGEVVQTTADRLLELVPPDAKVATPDEERIGGVLKEVFGDRFSGGFPPLAENLARFFIASPSILKPEPLPLYLNAPC